jgi:hypothetical protein
MTAGDYNYRVFPPEDDVEVFARWPEVLKVGTKAPDPELVELASGQTVPLSSYTRRGLTVVELGSLT